MKVIALIRRTIDGVMREPGGKPFDLDIEPNDELILSGVLADADAPAPVDEKTAKVVDHPIGYVGRQSAAAAEPVLAPEPVSTEFPAVLPTEQPTEQVAQPKKNKGASRA